MLEGLQAEIQLMRSQPSPSPAHLSNPHSEDSPIPSPFGDPGNEEHDPINVPMASRSPAQVECGELSTGDALTRVNTGSDVQMDLHDYQPVQNSPEIVQIDE